MTGDIQQAIHVHVCESFGFALNQIFFFKLIECFGNLFFGGSGKVGNILSAEMNPETYFFRTVFIEVG